MEIAFVSFNKLRFEIGKNKHRLTSSIISIFCNHHEQFITTMLVGNNIVLVLYSLKMTELLTPFLSQISGNQIVITLLQTFIATVLVLFTGEFLPKTIFKNVPNLWLNIFAVPLLFFYILLFPIAKICSLISMLILKIFNLENNDENRNKVLSKTDLDFLLQETSLTQDKEVEQEVKILQNALDLSSVKLRNCIVPRTEIVAVEKNDLSLENLKSVFVETGYSKVLIFNESIDNIIGYIHSQEILKNPKDLTAHIRKMPIVPETMAANQLMKLFMKQKRNIAVVVDEFGGTAGIVTLEDIMEEIFGEIQDEHDTKEYVAKRLSENEFLFSGRKEISEINEQFQLSLPESDDYQTIAGFILYEYADFPKVNQTIIIKNFNIKIIKADKNLIELIKLRVL